MQGSIINLNIALIAAGGPAASRLRWVFLGAGLLFLGWWVLSLLFHELIISSPWRPLRAWSGWPGRLSSGLRWG